MAKKTKKAKKKPVIKLSELPLAEQRMYKMSLAIMRTIPCVDENGVNTGFCQGVEFEDFEIEDDLP